MASVTKRRWTHNGVTKEAWLVRYSDPATGRRPGKTFELKKDADAFRRKVEREIEDGTHTAEREAKTVADVVDEYLLSAEQRVSDGRIGQSRLNVMKHSAQKVAAKHLGRRPIKDVTMGEIEKLYATLIRQGLSPHSAKGRLIDFKLIEDFARKRGYTKTSPVADALRELRGVARPRVRTFTAEQIATLLAAVDTRRPHAKVRFGEMMRCMVHLGTFCGLRKGEMLGLTLANVDVAGRRIQVRHSLTQYDELKGPKTAAGIRDVPLPASVAALLGDWIDRHYVENDRGLIFRGTKGQPINPATFHEAWLLLLNSAGLGHACKPFHFHALRHFASSWMIENGVSLTDVAGLLGHSTFDVTLQVYAHPVLKPAMRLEKMERMVALLPAPADTTLTQQV
ncbi:hypothetical protein BRX36_19835 [Sphingomonas sp. S-NIH.Pt1_0416]|uniref:tyrosine-type recombinase/integrase n=1 Tax=Sphingomonas sp. S-NIH.Pt1_0416 TaxID=1920123 RepID=UPI000F7E39F8|nr:site-specific integrase [Sphingomonas sp. S-NIH.Pt1_0416]RSU58918.1 hypothetical protein BRX36_19835 [Sphingomonas sp. S-NIH.Pt1_0416]